MEAKKLLESVSKQIESYNNIKFEFNYVLNNRKEQINQESKGEITVAGDLYKLDFLEATQLLDTKYEFGKKEGEIFLIDEIHTPDSSRYFYKEGYDYQWDITQRT